MWGFCETNLSTQNPHFLAAQDLQAGKRSIRGFETGQASQITVSFLSISMAIRTT